MQPLREFTIQSIMKRRALMRLLSLLATIICVGNLIPFFLRGNFPFFLKYTYEGAWEWNSVTLFDIASLISWNQPALMNYFKLISALAIISGFLPLIPGLFGAFRPQFRCLSVLAITTSAIMTMSIVSLYAMISIIIRYLGHRAIVEPQIGTYIAAAIVILEVMTAILARNPMQKASC
jgi:hypothetical protein